MNHLFIGWDVGGWNCDRNPSSRDALVILNDQREVIGTPWRGNLRSAINQSVNTASWIEAMLKLCGVEPKEFSQSAVVMGIDTPLGFSDQFRSLVVTGKGVEMIGESASNPYLFRYTERYLFERGLSPLSPVKDMIGSQATKGIHVLARFAPDLVACGVWSSSDRRLTAIEAYPSACKDSSLMRELVAPYITDVRYVIPEERLVAGLESPPVSPPTRQQVFSHGLDHVDHQDALVCALIAWLFQHQPDALAQPDVEVPESEGWIYVPVDTLGS